MHDSTLVERAREILKLNDFGDSTRPAPRLYPHQWLWDSCFIAIGLRHEDPERAVREIESLFKGQWKNGMLPHIIFNREADYHAGPDMWASEEFDDAPRDVQTSCITQPPMVAEAMVKIGEKLDEPARKAFFRRNVSRLAAYHAWLYRERDPENTGLVTLIHAWEAGNEDTPHWSEAMKAAAPEKVVKARAGGSFTELDAARQDLKHAPLEQRPSSEDFYTLYHTFEVAKSAGFNLAEIENSTNLPLIRDSLFNAALVCANRHLKEIASEAEFVLPPELIENMVRTEQVLADLISTSEDAHISSIDHRSGEALPERSISNLMALYALKLDGGSVAKLESAIKSTEFWPKYGVATTPTDSPYYHERRFWQGPVWVNTNWLLQEGARQNGLDKLADKIKSSTISMIEAGREVDDSIFENYSAQTAAPGGTRDFSWSAALLIDLINS